MRMREVRLPSNETEPPETVKSIPVWRMAVWQVSPSMPTQADAACEPDPPEGSLGVGTVKVPVTDLKVPVYTNEPFNTCL